MWRRRWRCIRNDHCSRVESKPAAGPGRRQSNNRVAGSLGVKNSKMLAVRLGRTGDATSKILARSIRFVEELTQDPSQALAEDHYLVTKAKEKLTGNAPYCF